MKIIFVCSADWGSASDTLSDALSFPPWNIAFGCQFICFIKITFVCLADWGSASDTRSDTLSFSPSNIAFDCPFISWSRSFVERLGDQQVSYYWYTCSHACANVTLTDPCRRHILLGVPPPALSRYSFVSFGCPFLSFIKITVVCLADLGSASDTLSFSPSNIAFGRPFLSFINWDHIRLFSGLGISKWYAKWYAQLISFKYCIWVFISFFHQDHVRLLSGLGMSKWYALWCARWYAQLSSFKYCISLSISFFH